MWCLSFPFSPSFYLKGKVLLNNDTKLSAKEGLKSLFLDVLYVLAEFRTGREAEAVTGALQPDEMLQLGQCK